MKVTVCLPSDLGRAELDRWRAIRALRPDLDNPFLSPEFTLAMGRARPEARVAIVEDDGRIVGYFPFEKRSLGLAVPMGAGLSDCQAIICERDSDLDFHALLARCGLSAWRFDHLVGTQRAMVAPSSKEAYSPVVDLHMGFDSYLAQREGHTPKHLQKERKLARELGATRLGFGVIDAIALGKMLEWKSEQYRRTGRQDRFARRSTVQLVEELAVTSTPDLTGTLATLHAGDRLVAVIFSLRSATTLASWFSAYDRELGRYAPGAILFLRMIEAAMTAGMATLDLGKGDEPYKSVLKTGDLPLGVGWAVRPVPMGYLRRGMSKPREIVLDTVLGHPPLRRAARAALQRLGSARLHVERTLRIPTKRA